MVKVNKDWSDYVVFIKKIGGRRESFLNPDDINQYLKGRTLIERIIDWWRG